MIPIKENYKCDMFGDMCCLRSIRKKKRQKSYNFTMKLKLDIR